MEKASVQRQKMLVVETKLGEERSQMESRFAEIQGKLSNIQPILDAAKEAVGSISQKDLVELGTFKTPPQAIRDVLAGVLSLLGIQDHSWNNMRNQLKKLKEQILNFDAKSITENSKKTLFGRETKMKKFDF